MLKHGAPRVNPWSPLHDPPSPKATAWSSAWREGRHHAEADDNSIPPRINAGSPAKADEIETLGFPLSIHPLERYEHILKGLNYVKARDLQAWVGKRVTTIGWMVTGKTVRTKEGDFMKFVSFEDPTGIYETVFFPKTYNQFCNMLNESRPYIIKGRVEEDFKAINIQVHWIRFLDSARPHDL